MSVSTVFAFAMTLARKQDRFVVAAYAVWRELCSGTQFAIVRR